MVYIREAHACDEWRMPLGTDLEGIDQPKSVTARIQRAKHFQHVSKISWNLVVDNMEDGFLRSYASWPERFFVVKNSEMVFVSDPDNFSGHTLDTLRNALLGVIGRPTRDEEAGGERDTEERGEILKLRRALSSMFIGVSDGHILDGTIDVEKITALEEKYLKFHRTTLREIFRQIPLSEDGKITFPSVVSHFLSLPPAQRRDFLDNLRQNHLRD